MNYLDLFSGAGGLSEGFARMGYKGIAHIESDKSAAETLETRMAYYYLKEDNKLDVYREYQKIYSLSLRERKEKREKFMETIPNYIKNSVINCEISYKNLLPIFEKVDKQLEINNEKKLDLIIGGPPCQAYSLIGRSRTGSNNHADKRHYLYKLYFEFLKKYRPKVFVFENVPGIYTAKNGKIFKDIQEKFDEAGYNIKSYDFNSFDFGIPQNRKRVIIMGFKKGLNVNNFEYPENKRNTYIVKDFFYDLPSIKAGEAYKDFKYKNKPTEALLNTKIRDKKDLLTHHISRPNNDRDLKIYKIAVESWNEKNERLKYSDLPYELITHKNTKSFLDRFKVVAGNLNYSQTIVAHIAKDGHYYIHPNIEENRSLSIREAARLQSFPDNYFFEGSRTSNFTQIGNAVPPLMSEYIARWIKKLKII
ncbi:DNA cytosine methyltransferase [Senegalia sp. (in: firmicutes)]|uniref:DNA cytosine methyltransferase n=1 Tax=Senegalia sp. (in: firmicutes) TaxID=1924098 RepID=UPI003F979F8B